MSRDDEGELVGQAFSAIDADGLGEVRGGVKVGLSGPIVTISAPTGADIDVERLQRVADINDVRIELSDHAIVVEPRGRYGRTATISADPNREKETDGPR